MEDEYSSTTTTVQFPSPIPLLRVPTPASVSDNPRHGPYVLAFKTPHHWATAYRSTASKITRQCEEGARVGCSISASNNCKPPWWKNLTGGRRLSEEAIRERERCEEREFEGCVVVAEEKCGGFAKGKCYKPFFESRIAVEDWEREVVRKVVSVASLPEGSRGGLLVGFCGCEFRVTNKKACELLGSDPTYKWFFS